jgi:hypothetical protein
MFSSSFVATILYDIAQLPSFDCDINALAIETFNDLLKKYGKRQSVENPLLDD